MRGLKLGVIFHTIKNVKTHKLIHDDLKALQFDLTCDKVTKPVDITVFEQYLKNEGDLMVPLDFIVPTDENKWSKKYHGFKLGALVHQIRIDVKREIGAFDKDDIQKLVELGFPLSHHEANRKGIVLTFKTFKEKFGHLNVVHDFKIDKDDLSWPQETRGIALGEILHHIRNYNYHKAIHKDLIELGVDLDPQIASPDFERVFKALSDYKVVHGNLLVPVKFVVPQDDVNYPPETWGMKLGSNVNSIRNNGAYSEHRVKLEELGFVFKKNKKVVEIV
jgi:hypothetical protein